VVLLVLAGLAASARADLFVFKDGFVVEGKTRREVERVWLGPESGIMDIPKGFFFIDDGARRVIFKVSEVRQAEKTGAPPEEVLRAPDPYQVVHHKMFPILEVLETTPWDQKWDRRITLRSENRDVTLPQRLRLLTPYRAEVVSRQRYTWGSTYLTREMSKKEVQGLLETAPELKEKSDMKPEVKAKLRFRKINFYNQLGWFDLAEQELDRLVTDMPEFKPRVEETRTAIASRRASEEFEAIKRLNQAGQDQAVRKRLAAFPRKEAAAKVLADVQDLESQLNTVRFRIKETSQMLERMRQQAKGAHSKELSQAAAYIKDNLHPENVNRLETFLAQARQFERQVKAGRKPTTSADEVLSLAVSGWLLGNGAADMHPENAVALWRAGEMVLAYLREERAGQRERVLLAYQTKNRTVAAGLDEVLRLIPSLPPVEPDEKLSEEVQERSASFGRRTVKYDLHLPPEYRHTRSYPVLMVLHDSTEKPREQLERWRKAAAENGYILAAPEWEARAGRGYNYSEAEHLVVLDTLRDLRRRFSVDSDRVFLFGLGQGGKMAFDVGLSHPSEFAGVMPMSATPELFAFHYWRNGQYLPFYVVHGNQGDVRTFEKLKDLFTYWTLRGGTAFPSLWVDYRGRGIEWFGGEVDNIFDWMRPKKRYFPMQELARHVGDLDTKFNTLRPWDNRFYWISVDGLSPRCIKTVDNFAKGYINPATVAGRIDSASNTIHVQAEGVRQVTIWLGHDSKGVPSINFTKPVTVSLNTTIKGKPRTVTPSLATLLEDLEERGDRQQMFIAKITLP
jgi:hypothetical protein